MPHLGSRCGNITSQGKQDRAIAKKRHLPQTSINRPSMVEEFCNDLLMAGMYSPIGRKTWSKKQHITSLAVTTKHAIAMPFVHVGAKAMFREGARPMAIVIFFCHGRFQRDKWATSICPA